MHRQYKKYKHHIVNQTVLSFVAFLAHKEFYIFENKHLKKGENPCRIHDDLSGKKVSDRILITYL